MLYSQITSADQSDRVPEQELAAVLSQVEKNADDIKKGKGIDELLGSTQLTAQAKEDIKKIAQEAAKEAGSEKGAYLKIVFALATSLATVYAGKPYCAAASRKIYDALYEQLLGIPKQYQPSYWLVYLPNREHASKLAYDWGPYLLSAIAGPTAYAVTSIPSAISSCVNKTLGVYEAAKDRLAPYLSAKEKNNAEVDDAEIKAMIDGFEMIEKVDVEAEDQQSTNECTTEFPDWTLVRREPLTFAAKTQLQKSISHSDVKLAVEQSPSHQRTLSM